MGKAARRVQRAERRVEVPEGMVEPLAVRRMKPEQRTEWLRLVEVGREVAELEERAREEVAAARRLGVSWSVIGSALGITGEGARRRFGDVS